jgi:hypothetical protein
MYPRLSLLSQLYREKARKYQRQIKQIPLPRRLESSKLFGWSSIHRPKCCAGSSLDSCEVACFELIILSNTVGGRDWRDSGSSEKEWSESQRNEGTTETETDSGTRQQGRRYLLSLMRSFIGLAMTTRYCLYCNCGRCWTKTNVGVLGTLGLVVVGKPNTTKMGVFGALSTYNNDVTYCSSSLSMCLILDLRPDRLDINSGSRMHHFVRPPVEIPLEHAW